MPLNLMANETLSEYYYWNSKAGQWVGNSKSETEYTSSGKDLQRIMYDWDDNTSLFVPAHKLEYSYDIYGIWLGTTYSVWDPSANAWVYDVKGEQYDDEEGLVNYMPFIHGM